MQKIVTLLTDFGLEDPYLAAMKGVILSGYDEALSIIDITHLIPQGDIYEAGYILRDVYKFFPRETLHLVVVDPGVGSDRKGLLAETPSGSFVLPDNGLLSFIHDDDLEEMDLFELPFLRLERKVSNTFHGRDLFAPYVVRLLNDCRIGLKPCKDWVRLDIPRAVKQGNVIEGEVIRIDKFGNAISNISDELLGDEENYSLIRGEFASISFDGVYPFYSAAPEEKAIAIIGSNGCLELAIRDRNAAIELGITKGTKVKVVLGK
jgi:S-adenosyl-L-methionine hydrolase (adenosine-forming)